MKKKGHYWIVGIMSFVVGMLIGTSYYIGKYDGKAEIDLFD